LPDSGRRHLGVKQPALSIWSTYFLATTFLPNDKALVAGGAYYSGGTETLPAAAELYTPERGITGLSVLQEFGRFFRQAGSFPADQGDMSRLWLATESTDDVGKPVGCRVDKGIVDLVGVSGKDDL
jgi:hypothetical protein